MINVKEATQFDWFPAEIGHVKLQGEIKLRSWVLVSKKQQSEATKIAKKQIIFNLHDLLYEELRTSLLQLQAEVLSASMPSYQTDQIARSLDALIQKVSL